MSKCVNNNMQYSQIQSLICRVCWVFFQTDSVLSEVMVPVGNLGFNIEGCEPGQTVKVYVCGKTLRCHTQTCSKAEYSVAKAHSNTKGNHIVLRYNLIQRTTSIEIISVTKIDNSAYKLRLY